MNNSCSQPNTEISLLYLKTQMGDFSFKCCVIFLIIEVLTKNENTAGQILLILKLFYFQLTEMDAQICTHQQRWNADGTTILQL